ncbi:hypothetical protein [Azospirillum halopraeferens]|uniref:hypothetical protein n=1 Tax=Azospirillum halopraeferens TaxID=34010 RepID=UPI000425058A|nr:hypothetical protein [Azospirillum halopraeferens]
MPIILFLILVVLIAQFGFWDTLQGVLGAVGMVILLLALLAAAAWATARLAFRRMRGGR